MIAILPNFLRDCDRDYPHNAILLITALSALPNKLDWNGFVEGEDSDYFMITIFEQTEIN